MKQSNNQRFLGAVLLCKTPVEVWMGPVAMLLWLVWLGNTANMTAAGFRGLARPSGGQATVVLQAQLYTGSGSKKAGVAQQTRRAGIATV